MSNQKLKFETDKELQEAILDEKIKGTPDLEIGQKYGVTYRYIERLITKSRGVNISSLSISKKIKTFYPTDFKEEQTSVWSFKKRGTWATHSGEYRGNWSPYIPRNIILKYSKPGEVVLDYFCGAGTTAVEAKLLGRRCICFDINEMAGELARKNLDFTIEPQLELTSSNDKLHLPIFEPELSVGDARDLSFLQDNSIDLICSHPPYTNIIHYTDSKEGDLSFLEIDDFLKEISKVARESLRVLKPGRQCAILIGDMRKHKRVIPLGFELINVYLDAGFKLKELIIKRQHNCKTTGFWYAGSLKYNFLLLAHEYLPVFEKPELQSTIGTKEQISLYLPIHPCVEKLSLKRKLDISETTTVWFLPEHNFEKQLNKNVIDRYSKDKKYSAITLDSQRIGSKRLTEIKKNDKELLFIKSPFLDATLSHSNTEDYLVEMAEILKEKSVNINDGGFVVIQTQDIRINGYIEPLAKKIVNLLKPDNLWLKEIIVVIQQDRGDLKTQTSPDYLEIVHQYLLVYEVTNLEKI